MLTNELLTYSTTTLWPQGIYPALLGPVGIIQAQMIETPSVVVKKEKEKKRAVDIQLRPKIRSEPITKVFGPLVFILSGPAWPRPLS